MARKLDKTVSYENLSPERKWAVLRAREAINDTLPQSIDEVKRQVSLVFTEADWFRLFHTGSNNNIGSISHSYNGKWNVEVNDININQSYQQYGFSALLLWLFYEEGLNKLSKLTGKDIPKSLVLAINWGREEAMQHVANKYFSTDENSNLTNPDMDAIYNSVVEKTQAPHTNFDNARFIV